jgi:hypothetical protein
MVCTMYVYHFTDTARLPWILASVIAGRTYQSQQVPADVFGARGYRILPPDDMAKPLGAIERRPGVIIAKQVLA